MTKFEFNDDARKAFRKLKDYFLQKPILRMIDQNISFKLKCSTSQYATRAVLLQKDTNRDKHPVAYYSRAFTPAEQNYHCSDQEFLVIIKALKEWQHYVDRSPYPIILWPDHKSLTRFREPQHLNRQQSHWTMEITRYNYKI